MEQIIVLSGFIGLLIGLLGGLGLAWENLEQLREDRDFWRTEALKNRASK